MKKNRNTNISNATGCNKSPAVYTGGKNPGRLTAAFIAAVLLVSGTVLSEGAGVLNIAKTAVQVALAFTPLGIASCKHDSDPPPIKKPQPTVSTHGYQDFSPGATTLNFNPNDPVLPVGITYTLTDDQTVGGNTPHSSGVVSFSSYTNDTNVTFTQTFYKDGKVVGSTVVKAHVFLGGFQALFNASNTVIPKIPAVTLTY